MRLFLFILASVAVVALASRPAFIGSASISRARPRVSLAAITEAEEHLKEMTGEWQKLQEKEAGIEGIQDEVSKQLVSSSTSTHSLM